MEELYLNKKLTGQEVIIEELGEGVFIIKLKEQQTISVKVSDKK